MTSDVQPRRLLGAWRLASLPRVRRNGLRVFSCFHCGGGSTMGYKLAGLEVLGGVEIDPRMMQVYRANHHPALSYLEGVQDFRRRADFDPRLLDLDILDGSPPCSAFSTAGVRDKKWGDAHVFREGQARQVLDDLFFEFIALAETLRPRVVIAENVKGLMVGKARGYVREIFDAFKRAGYGCQLYLLNASRMGVPQRRERTVFVAVRSDIGRKVSLAFDEPLVGLQLEASVARKTNNVALRLLPHVRQGDYSLQPADERLKRKPRATGSYFGHQIYWGTGPTPTLISNGPVMCLMPSCGFLTDLEITQCQTFPQDFDFASSQPQYICGMSVPPYMMQRVALEVGAQVFGADYDRRAPAPAAEVFA